MKKNMKRILAAMLSTALVVSMASCSAGGGASSDGGDSKPESKTESKAEAGGSKTLEFWHIQTRDPFPKIIQDSIDRFQKDNPDYKVNVVPTANDAYKQKVTVAMGSGQTPDMYPSWSGGPMIEYIEAGHAYDMTELMNKDNYKDKFLDAAIDQTSYNGKIYGVPVENVSICGVFYNKDMFKEFGLEEPKTMEELEKLCDTIKSKGKIPFSLANKTQWTGSMYYMSFATRFGGLQSFQDAASGKGTFEDEGNVFAGKKIQEWVDKGYFNEGFNGLDEDSGQSRQLMYTEDCAMTVMGSWFVGSVKGENPEFYEKVGFFTFPTIAGKEENKDYVIGTVGDNYYHISGTCKDPEGAFKALTYLVDDQAVKDRTEAGRITPVKGLTVEDPILKTVMDKVNAAPGAQLWYDQYLPPAVSDVHKTTSQEIFGKTLTPEEANKQMQTAMQEYLNKK